MKNKIPFLLLIVVITTICISLLVLGAKNQSDASLLTQSVAVDPVSSTITAEGSIHSQNEATLHFQTGGKLVYLPFREGDAVASGQTIARLDSYALQRSLQLAANSYETTKNSVDQAQENQQAGVLEGQQRTTLDSTNKNGYNSTITEAQLITDAVKRIVDSNQLAQNSSQINVDLANYALQLANLTAPFDGIITHEDVTIINQNVTPATGFTLIDPSAPVFRAHILPTDIDFVSEGASATIHVDGQNKTYSGTVTKIYPDKTTLANGQSVYMVDIQSTELKRLGSLNAGYQFGQSGTVTIQSNTSVNVIIVPTWTVLNHNFLWVTENGRYTLKRVTVGKTHGTSIEITSGLSAEDRVITDPKGIAQHNYPLL